MLVASLLLGLAAAASRNRGDRWWEGRRVGVGVLEGEKEAARRGSGGSTSLKGGLGLVEKAGEVSWQPADPGSASGSGS